MSRIVFVAGLHRSGTTALARTLATHPDISGFAGTGVKEDEGQHLQDLYPPARAYGGAGRFATSHEAHLTESSDLVTPQAAERLMAQWGPHWDLSKSVLVEKSPPNLVMTRFLQAVFPESSFLVVVRHPAVVALSTARWRRFSGLSALVHNWLVAHETFAADAQVLDRVHVVRYEHLTADPASELARIATFLGLVGPVHHGLLQQGRSDSYVEQWRRLSASRGPGGRRLRRMIDTLEPRVSEFGYSLNDLTTVGTFPQVGRP